MITMQFRTGLAAIAALSLTASGLWAAVPTATAAEPDRLHEAVRVLERGASQAREVVGYNVVTNVNHLLAFAVAGKNGKAHPEGQAWKLLDTLVERVRLDPTDPTKSALSISANPLPATRNAEDLSRVALIASIYSQNPKSFAARDLIAELGALSHGATNAVDGWLKTSPVNPTPAQTANQAMTVIAFKAAGASTQLQAGALLSQQRANGSFSQAYTPSTSNTLATGYAVLALLADASPAALAAVPKAADYLVSQQLEAGNFTGATAPRDAAIVAAALRAAGRTASADAARGYIAGLQVIADQVDEVWAGGIATNAAQRDAILDGSLYALPNRPDYDPTQFQKSYEPTTARALLAFSDQRWEQLKIAEVGKPRPAVTSPTDWVDGYCEGDEGVTVIVDTAYLSDDEPTIRCVHGHQTSGWAALENAGILVESHPGYVGDALCKLQGLPAQGYPYCWLEQPGVPAEEDDHGYWSYWHASPGETTWTYSNWGANNRTPIPGGVEGWRFLDLTPRDDVPVSIPPYPPAFEAAPVPTIAGTVAVGSVLTAELGAWSPLPGRVLYTWLRDGKAIKGAAKATYTPTVDDLGTRLSLRVRGVKSDRASATRTSQPTPAVVEGTLQPTPTPTISGTPTVGQKLTAVPGTWGPSSVRLAYAWYRSGAPISGATAATYQLTPADQGQQLSVRVTGSRDGFTPVSKESARTSAVKALVLTTPTPTIKGTAKVGRKLTAAAAWGPSGVKLSYRWLRDGKTISGATNASYTLVSSDRGRKISVRVTGSLSGATTVAKTSAVTKPVGYGTLTAPKPSLKGTPKVGRKLTASTGKWKPAGVKLSYQWLRNVRKIAKATTSSYQLTKSDAKK